MSSPSTFLDGFSTHDVPVGDLRIHARVGGSGDPVLLLHGYPQTHVMWHRVAPRLAQEHTVVVADLRGYGDSDRPVSGGDHAAYSKRAMAADQVGLMGRWATSSSPWSATTVAPGSRTGWCLDHPERVTRAAVLDIAPTRHVFAHVDRALAHAYEHWFFLPQADRPARAPDRRGPGVLPAHQARGLVRRPDGLRPEPRWRSTSAASADPEAIHASCEDYRAAAGIDLEHDEQSRARRRASRLPAAGAVGGRRLRRQGVRRAHNWREYADDVRGAALDCGHFVPEEAPGATVEQLLGFLGA